ncbi:hypothetical protein DFH06DRAFT_1347161 [Mycena polygramma]|nr:hypothetical protein DFH06DRAFT_1347161 [Mycena polygramma]
MHTGKWWWSTQEAVEKENPGATIIPIIVSSDKTQLTVFGNKTAYPVHMEMQTIPLRLHPPRLSPDLAHEAREKQRGAQTYLPTLANLVFFHACMSYMLEPLKTAGIPELPMTSGDGVTRRSSAKTECPT